MYKSGKYAPSLDAGGDQRMVKFFLDEAEPSAKLVGERAVWSWPFPEGALVPRQLEGGADGVGISGDSSVGMGTAPPIWNVVMGLMVKVGARSMLRATR